MKYMDEQQTKECKHEWQLAHEGTYNYSDKSYYPDKFYCKFCLKIEYVHSR